MKSVRLALVFSCLFCSHSVAEVIPLGGGALQSLPAVQPSVTTVIQSFQYILPSSFYGILVAFIICNLIFFAACRDQGQGYVVIALTLLGLHHILAVDLAIWRQEQLPWLASLLPSLLIGSSIAWLSFTLHFYEKLSDPPTAFIIKAVSILALTLMISLPFIPQTTAILIATGTLLSSYSLVLYVSIHSWKRRNSSPLYISSAIICLTIASTLGLANDYTQHFIELNVFAYIKLLTVLAALLLTMSLAVRFHRLLIVKNSLTQVTKNMLLDTANTFDRQLARRTEVLTNNQDNLIQEIQLQKVSLEDTLDQLKASNQLKDDFLNKISHEFKTPLNGILGPLQLVKQTSLNNEQKDYVLSALGSGQKLSQLIDDVLDLSQLNAGLIKLKKEPFSLHATISHVYNVFQQYANEKGLKYVLEYSPKMPQFVKGDQQRLSQVLEKLIANAVKFTAKGTIKITADVLESYGENVALLFRVSDTGIGIPQDMQDGIFESFRQVERFFSRQYEGTGIGLAISYHLVKQMGGNISVESSPGTGSTFQFTVHLPVVVRKNTTTTQSNIREIKQQRPLQGKLLVVEDNKVNQMVLLGLLKKMGLSADIADNGKIALQMLKIKHYDLILMDCQMPVMNGFETTRAIRHNEGDGSRIPVIAVTANSQASNKIECVDAGMDDFIPKPINTDALYHKLSEWLFGDKRDTKFGNANRSSPLAP